MNIKECLDTLLIWYNQNQRKLPWRKNNNPYPVWISEIMLQQTRVEAVIDYFNRFLKEIPDVKTLSEIDDEILLKLWEGLGYYSRARNLKQAAIQIMNEYNGSFPNTYHELLKLKGIGKYTAAAIASISFQEKVPAIDGNVLRVMMRILNSYDDITKTKTKQNLFLLLQPLMNDKPGNLNQAFMDLGATICIPNGNPKCETCPIQKYCQSYKNKTMLELPIKPKKITKKQEEYTILICTYKNEIALTKRPNKGLLANFYAFPNIAEIKTEQEIKEYLKKKKISINKIEKGPTSKHIFTHKIWYMESYYVELSKKYNQWIWVTYKDLEEKYPLPGAYQLYKNYIYQKQNTK